LFIGLLACLLAGVYGGAAVRPWCHKTLPSAYGYVQDVYWDVGLFKFYRWDQVSVLLKMTRITTAACTSSIWHMFPFLLFDTADDIKKNNGHCSFLTVTGAARLPSGVGISQQVLGSPGHRRLLLQLCRCWSPRLL
jgi:hypothetical protein